VKTGTRKRKKDLSGLPGWPLLLDKETAAAFVSLEPDEFATAVLLGQLPPPERVLGIERWARPALEATFDRTGARPIPGHDPILSAIDAAVV
jgi:hypothetical protein